MRERERKIERERDLQITVNPNKISGEVTSSNPNQISRNSRLKTPKETK